MALAGVPEVCLPDEAHLVGRDARAGEQRATLVLERFVDAVELVEPRAVERPDHAARELERRRRGQKAEGGCDTGTRGDDRPAHL